jgi:hypothetical protein
VAAMWFKRVSDVIEITRICGPSWHTALSGCWEATPDFSLQSILLYSNKNIVIIGTLDFLINASLIVYSAVAKTFLSIYCLLPSSWR